MFDFKNSVYSTVLWLEIEKTEPYCLTHSVSISLLCLLMSSALFWQVVPQGPLPCASLSAEVTARDKAEEPSKTRDR